MARASRWFEELASGRVPSPAEIAKRESLQKGYVARLTRLAFFAPRIVDAVAGGLTKLMTGHVMLPLEWREQERFLDLEGAASSPRTESLVRIQQVVGSKPTDRTNSDTGFRYSRR
jgi:hypothetical protein